VQAAVDAASAGDEIRLAAGLTDIDGEMRPQGTLPDLGVNEANMVLPVDGGTIIPSAGVTITVGSGTFTEAIVADYTPHPITGTDALGHVGLFYDLDAFYLRSGQPAQLSAGKQYTIT
jgi:hypothetical protein